MAQKGYTVKVTQQSGGTAFEPRYQILDLLLFPTHNPTSQDTIPTHNPTSQDSWPSIFAGSASVDSTNHRLKIFEKILQCC